MTPKVLSTEAWSVLRRLIEGGWLESRTLAGGAGLALQLGHRYSEDLHFFSSGAFEPEQVIQQLSEIGPVSIQSQSSSTLHVDLAGLRVNFLGMQTPLLYPGIPYRGLTLADPRDIAVMKLVAIGGRGSRKDFVDLYFYLQAGGSLESLFEMARSRSQSVDYNEYHLLKSLVYFDDAESEPMPEMIREASWSEIKKTIVAEVRRLSAWLGPLPRHDLSSGERAGSLSYHRHPMTASVLEIDRERLAELCQRHGIRRLAVFGSAARGEVRPGSDIDLLVEFTPGRRVGLRFIAVQEELSKLMGQEVDLNTPAFLSPHFRDRVTAEAIPIYEAA